MSVSRLTEGLQCSVTFFPHWCILHDLATRMMIGLGEERNGLYYLVALASNKAPSIPRPTCHLAISAADLWHRRLGHISSSRWHFLAKSSLDCPSQFNGVCDACHLAK